MTHDTLFEVAQCAWAFQTKARRCKNHQPSTSIPLNLATQIILGPWKIWTHCGCHKLPCRSWMALQQQLRDGLMGGWIMTIITHFRPWAPRGYGEEGERRALARDDLIQDGKL